jgi:pyridoxamine 5'-phosphate oxidase
MDLFSLRREYMSQGLRRSDLADDPLSQFSHWFDQARDTDMLDPNAMVVATVDPDGQPSARNVLLKAYDKNGFIFYTNLESRKARQIANNAKVALLFTWLPFNRQIKIEGLAEKISTAESRFYFIRRTKKNQWAAWASPQSQNVSSRQLLEEKFFEMKEKFSKGEVPLPSFWGGYRIKPHKIEFWQGRENRLHDRFLYTLQQDKHWLIERLAP